MKTPRLRLRVRLTHVAWRDGRPRFSPGPALRALGFKGEDLRHPSGAWLNADEARLWVERRLAEIQRRRADPKARAVAAKAAGAAAVTVETLFDDFWRSKRFRDQGQPGGLAKATARDYRNKANALRDYDPELWTSHAAAITQSIALGLFERLWEDKGLAMAHGMIAVLRLVYSHAMKRRPEAGLGNPCKELGLPGMKPRLRVATGPEIVALARAADAGEPEIADAIVLALHTAQRQADVLQLSPRAEEAGKIRFVQNKTGARVRVRATDALRERLAAARQRALDHGHVFETFVLDSRSGKPFIIDTFRHRFAEVRAEAAKTCPSVADLLFLDLRDTAITRMANAGATIPEIAAVSGHSLVGVTTILKHYLETNEAQSDAAMDKLAAWMNKEGMKL